MHGHRRRLSFGDVFEQLVAFPGGPRMRGRGGRMRRGDVRAAILLLLEEEPRNGYQVMQELEQRTGGAWRPSPGSVYPALQLLADEGLVRSEPRDGGNVFELTDAGRAHVEEHRGRPRRTLGAGRSRRSPRACASSASCSARWRWPFAR